MINRDDIEAGDKVYTRDGGCLVAHYRGSFLFLGPRNANDWREDGKFQRCGADPLDIIRIEKAPKPVVKYLGFSMKDGAMHGEHGFADEWPNVIKLTYVNGKLEKSEQVK